jgi:2-polyprenyl-6-methoxyphenol hydroxylase-like FAD-dependent oxidoreductase
MESAMSNLPASTNSKGRVLVSGASFAGLSTAYWMDQLGYDVTLVEIGKTLKKGGTPVNIEGDTIDIVRRMGLLEQIQAATLPARPVEFVDASGARLALMSAQADSEHAPPEYEIERDELLEMQFEQVKNDVDFLFGDSIERMQEIAEEINVTFRSGQQQTFCLVFGCDGSHSSVRRMCFGEESAYSVFLQLYFSITIVEKLLIQEDTTQIFNAPGKTVMLSAYHGKTDICFGFFSEEEIPYDYRDQAKQRSMIAEHLGGAGWRTRELLEEVRRSESFYFDKLCQVKMPSWTKGRVALVGDAAYCASPAAGMGGSLAIVGASALADAFREHPNHVEAAFRQYNDNLRPFIEKVQADAVEFGLDTFAPRSEEAIRARNERFATADAALSE